MENKFFATAIFLIFGIFMVTSHLNFAIAADSEGGDTGGDDKKESSKDSGDDKKDSGDDDKQQNKEGSDSNDNQDTQLSSSNDESDDNEVSDTNTQQEAKDKTPSVSDESGDAIIKSTPTPNYIGPGGIKSCHDCRTQEEIDKASNQPTQDEIDKEKAAIEDYIYDDPGKIKPYSTEGVKEPWRIKLIESLNKEAEEQKKPTGGATGTVSEDDPYEVCDSSTKCKGPGHTETSDTNCIGYYCFGENSRAFEQVVKSGNCDGVNDSPEDAKDCLENGGIHTGECNGLPGIHYHRCPNPNDDKDKGKGNEGNHPDKDKCNHWNDHCKKDEDWGHHHEGGHKHHDNNYCRHHDCHHHHHSSTHFSNHEGDVTVKIDLKYEEKDKDNLDDFFLFIGDVYDKEIDLSDKPDQIKVDHLDIDGGDDFAVCLANEDSQNGDCTVVEADNDHDTVNAFLTVR